ncbi:MAG TPA: DUF2510 domain-containing protein [Acidimicrobiales bacterium]
MAPGWYPDPTGRHEHRYYNGTEWTEQVSDGGVIGLDPINSTPVTGAPGAKPQSWPRRAARRYLGWPLWAKIAAPVAALAVVGGVANAVSDDERPTHTKTNVEAPADETTTTAARTTTTTVPATTAPSTTAAPTTVAPVETAPPTAPAAVAPPVPSQTEPQAPPAPPPPQTEPTQPETVHPGAYCSPPGATGVTTGGVPMICSTTNADGVPYKDGRAHWRKA